MSEMVERVARAIWKYQNDGLDWPGPQLLPEWTIVEARVAIAAMGEPTVAMILRGGAALFIDGRNGDLLAKAMWELMVLEALK